MAIRHTNIIKDREKLKRVLHNFILDVEVLIDKKTKDDNMKGWDTSGGELGNSSRLVSLRTKLRDLVTKATVGRVRGLEQDIVLTACLIKYHDDADFRQYLENQY